MTPQQFIFKFHVSAFTFLCALCCTLQQAHASGPWLVDGQTVQTLEVQTTNDDPAALHTDGTRTMQAPLEFDPSVPSPSAGLFKAYVPWEYGYRDLFLFDDDEDAIRLSNASTGFYPSHDLYISGTVLGDATGGGRRVDIGETTLKGGTWMVDSVGPYPECIISKGFADNRYHQKSAITTPLKFDPALSSASVGLFKATVPWDAEYDFFSFDEDYEALALSPTLSSLGFEAGNLIMHGYGTLRYKGDPGTYISFEERNLGGDGWITTTVFDDPMAIMNRSYADNRYHQKSAITSPLKFDPSLSSPASGLIKATVPWDAEYDFFAFNEDYETVVLSPTVSSLGFEAANLIMHGYGTIRLKGESTFVSFEERLLGGGGWMTLSVADDPYSILNRTYADNRYVQKSAGITTNHTFQAGDVLQIQNGVITAINP